MNKTCTLAGMLRPISIASIFISLPWSVLTSNGIEPYTWTNVDHAINRYCYECHGGFSTDAGLDLINIDHRTDLETNPGKWMNILQALRTHYMPHPDGRVMPAGPREQLIKKITGELARLSVNHDSNSAPLRRLNRAEFNNTLNDLFMVHLNWAESLPADDAGYGFDNIAAALTFSPLLMDRYFDAAAQVAAIAVPQKLSADEWSVAAEDFAGSHSDGGRRVIATDGRKNGAHRKIYFPGKGRYDLSLKLSADQAGDELARTKLWFDGQSLGEQSIRSGRNDAPTVVMRSVHIQSPGEYKIEVGLANDFYRETESGNLDRNLIFHSIELKGPLQSAEDLQSPFLDRHFGGLPENLTFKKLNDGIHRFASRAYRRPITSEESIALWDIFLVNSQLPDMKRDVRNGLYAVIDAVITSPAFLFRLEGTSETYTVDSFALASWLSYFIWSSMPDDRLFELAQNQQLQANLEGEVQRMLADPKAVALADNFAGQWWRFRDIDIHRPDRSVYKSANKELLAAMREETKRFFLYNLENDRSLLDFLNADYTFVNEALAAHYGIGGVQGAEFQKVSLDGTSRRGVWSQGSILTVTSHPNHTSPVLRGQWILENLIGLSPPPPPDNVPSLPGTDGNPHPEDLRASLAMHRANSDCASCHNIMDPIGLALEHFDGVGGLRSVEERKKLSNETLFDGSVIKDPNDLAKYFEEQRSEDFIRNVGRKLSIYASGRGLDWRDEAALQRIADYTRERDFRFSAIIQAVVIEFAPKPKIVSLSRVTPNIEAQ